MPRDSYTCIRWRTTVPLPHPTHAPFVSLIVLRHCSVLKKDGIPDLLQRSHMHSRSAPVDDGHHSRAEGACAAQHSLHDTFDPPTLEGHKCHEALLACHLSLSDLSSQLSRLSCRLRPRLRFCNLTSPLLLLPLMLLLTDTGGTAPGMRKA